MRKLIPLIIVLILSACASVQPNSGHQCKHCQEHKCEHCEKCKHENCQCNHATHNMMDGEMCLEGKTSN